MIDKQEKSQLSVAEKRRRLAELLQKKVDQPRYAPLSFAQQRLWFLDQLNPHTPVYNIAGAARLIGSVNIEAIEKSFHEIVKRHEILRTSFSNINGAVMQVITKRSAINFSVKDLSAIPTDRQPAIVIQHIEDEAHRPFDLSQDTLLRILLLRLNKEEITMLVVIHHIISDALSMGILLREFFVLYSAFSIGAPSPLRELPMQYADFAVWQRERLQGEYLEKQLDYWQQQLGNNLPVLQLPTDHPRPTFQSLRGATRNFIIPLSLSLSLEELAHQEGATLFMTLLTAFNVLLFKYTNQDDLVVGSPIANRNRVEIESMIGFFVNMLVLRTDLSGNPTFREVLRRVKKVALEAYTHQELPFEKLVEHLQPERNLSHSPLFQVTFQVLNSPMPTTSVLAGVTLQLVDVTTNTAKFDLSLLMTKHKNEIRGSLEYKLDLFDETTIDRFIGHFQTVLQTMTTHPDQPLHTLSLLSEEERRQLLVEWNNTEASPAENTACIHEAIEAQAQRTPDSIAIISQEESLTYRELSRRSNQLASYLRSLGVGPNTCVGICLEHSLDLPIGLLGILKAGGAYVPLDPHYPVERLVTMLEQAQISLLLTHRRLDINWPKNNICLVYLDTNLEQLNSDENTYQIERATADDLIYVIYTSGSTGQPKGAGVYHRGFSNLMNWFSKDFGITSHDHILLITSLSFDLTQKNIFAPLLVGGKLCLLAPGYYDPDTILQTILAQQITILNCTPSAFYPLLESAEKRLFIELASLRYLFLGGEPISMRRLQNWLTSPACRAQVVNTYGPTECTDVVAYHRLSHAESQLESQIPIGRPIPNVQLVVLDEHYQLLPVGFVGELYIAGDCVGTGYINDDTLTQTAFLPNPFSEIRSSRLYKTGDRAYYQPDGTLIFVERVDRQVKIRGFRIEPGEIEASLATHPALRECVVTMCADLSGEMRLVAYVVPTGQQILSPTDLRKYLQERLPGYMIPSTFVILSSLPLTPNGKVDHQALPVPRHMTLAEAQTSLMPRDMWEYQLARIWEELLDRESVGVRDKFFESGGDSLLAIRLMSRIQECFGRAIPLSALFVEATIEHLADILRGEAKVSHWSPLVSLQPNGPMPPLFIVHDASGMTITFAHLGRFLGQDQPLYGLQAKGLEGEQAPYVSVESMAEDYVAAIRTVQPEGPYLLAGVCVGGIVALEMAQQLQALGQTVAFLALLDTTNDQQDRKALLELMNVFNTQKGQPTQYDYPTLWPFIYAGPNLPLPPSSLDYLRSLATEEEQSHYILEQLAETNDLHPTLRLPNGFHILNVRKQNTLLLMNYIPRAYSGEITLLRARDSIERYPDDPYLGWGNVAHGRIRFYDMPMNHDDMWNNTNVEFITNQLKACLREVGKS